MTNKKRLAGAMALCFVASGWTLSTTGCDMFKKDEETEEEVEAEEEEEEEPEPEASASAAPEDTVEVETFPECTGTLQKDCMLKAGGTFRLLKRFSVHKGPDDAAERLTFLAAGTLVDFKFFFRDWILIDWPSGPGELSPGWIHIRPAERAQTTKREERKEEPDAGKTETDAGKETPDAGKTEEKTDAGRRSRFKFKLPPTTKTAPK